MADFSATDAGWLLSGADPVAYTEVEWIEESGSWRADLPIAADGFNDDEVNVVLQVARAALWRPRAILCLREITVRRICVNRAHRENGRLIPVQTHAHGRSTGSSPESYLGPVELTTPVPVGGPVEPLSYLSLLQDLASMTGIDLQGMTWTEPPGGGPE